MEDFTSKLAEMLYEQMAGRDDLHLENKLQAFISDALSRLCLARGILNDENKTELSYHELAGITKVVNEVYCLLVKANRLYFDEEGKQYSKNAESC
jgi:hypothetical protein